MAMRLAAQPQGLLACRCAMPTRRKGPVLANEISTNSWWNSAACSPCARLIYTHSKNPGQEALEKILGKVRGALVHRNGERVLFADLSVSLVNLPGIRQYQVTQEAIEKFTVKVVSLINQDEKKRDAFMAHFGYLPDTLRIEYVEGIAKEKNGKFYASICRVETS